MKITVICLAGVTPNSLKFIDCQQRGREHRIKILEFETPDHNIEIFTRLIRDSDVMSFEVNKPEKWKDFFPLKPDYPLPEVQYGHGKDNQST